MENERKETVLKEYPNSTRWTRGQQIIGVGNLILTNERLVFLHGVELTPRQIAYVKKISGTVNDAEEQ